jgi:hypothetical protein
MLITRKKENDPTINLIEYNIFKTQNFPNLHIRT